MGANGNKSNQNSNSAQSSEGWSDNFVNGAQQPFLSSLWSQSMGMANPQAAQGAAQDAANTVLPGLKLLFDQQWGAGQTGLQAFKSSQTPQQMPGQLANAQNTAFQAFQRSQQPQSPTGTLAALMNPQGQINAQTNSLRSGLNQQWSEDLLPALRGNAIQAGGFGGGRQGVSEGVAAGGLMKAFTQGRGDIVANANNQALQAQDLWQTGQANRAQNGIAAGQLGMQAQDLWQTGQANRAQNGIAAGQLGSQAGQIGQGLSSAITAALTLPSVAGLDPLARLAEILGAPNMLSSSHQVSSGSSTGQGKTGGFGFSFT